MLGRSSSSREFLRQHYESRNRSLRAPAATSTTTERPQTVTPIGNGARTRETSCPDLFGHRGCRFRTSWATADAGIAGHCVTCQRYQSGSYEDAVAPYPVGCSAQRSPRLKRQIAKPAPPPRLQPEVCNVRATANAAATTALGSASTAPPRRQLARILSLVKPPSKGAGSRRCRLAGAAVEADVAHPGRGRPRDGRRRVRIATFLFFSAPDGFRFVVEGGLEVLDFVKSGC